MDGTDEEFVPEDESEDGPALVKRLREKLKKTVDEKQEYLDGWQRAKADFANYKREEVSMHADKEGRHKAQLVEELIPALDTFELALKHGNKELEMVYKQLLDGLRRIGVERFGAAGDPFDPRLHEALRQVDTEKPEEDHTIYSIERSGYKIDETIIRPAQVTINNYNG